MRSRHPASIIRAVLFIVRLQKSISTRNARRRTRKVRTKDPQALAYKAPNGHVSHDQLRAHSYVQGAKLKRCQSVHGRHIRSTPSIHRNSAPETTLLFRSPTPHVEEYTKENASLSFDSFALAVKPYVLKRRSPFGGSSLNLGWVGAKLHAEDDRVQSIHATPAHYSAAASIMCRLSKGDKVGFFDPPLQGRPTTCATNNEETSVHFATRKVHQSNSTSSAIQNEARRLERKLKHSMINLFGALTAIEQGDIGALQMILTKNIFPINEPVDKGLYAEFEPPLNLLDVALLTNRPALARILIEHAAKENPQLSEMKKRREVVERVISRLEHRRGQLGKVIANGTNVAKESTRRMQLLEHQLRTVLAMKDTIKGSPSFPAPPVDVTVEVHYTQDFQVASSNGVLIAFSSQPLVQDDGVGGVITKYKVEWSKSADFNDIDGSMTLTDVRRRKSIRLEALEHGQNYFFRLAAASIWGFGEWVVARPSPIRISSWDDCTENAEATSTGQFSFNHTAAEMRKLYQQVERYRASTVWQHLYPNHPTESKKAEPAKKRPNALRHLFSAGSKFVKGLYRGIYLASIIYGQGRRVLCTVDECLPIICVEEGVCSVGAEETNWLTKMAMCWDQAQYYKDSMPDHYSSASHLRMKILEAAIAMHNAVGIDDIGPLHHVPITHRESGVILLITVRMVQDEQAAKGLAVRWIKLEKLLKKRFSSAALDYACKELLGILNFYESSQILLDRGLYLAFLRLQSTINEIRVVVPENMPSMLPFASVRSNPHVTEEEWRSISTADAVGAEHEHSVMQLEFCQQIWRAARVLAHDLELERGGAADLRLYKLQILQMHPSLSLILMLPRAEDMCQMSTGEPVGPRSPSQEDASAACIYLPLSVFQMLNFSNYRPEFISAYSRLSTFLDHFTSLVQYQQRQCLLEADSKNACWKPLGLKVYSEQLEHLNDFQQQLDQIWKGSRWINNITGLARDRQMDCSVPLAMLAASLGKSASFSLSDRSNESDESRQHAKQANTTAKRLYQARTRLQTTANATKQQTTTSPPMRNRHLSNALSSQTPMRRSLRLLEPLPSGENSRFTASTVDGKRSGSERRRNSIQEHVNFASPISTAALPQAGSSRISAGPASAAVSKPTTPTIPPIDNFSSFIRVFIAHDSAGHIPGGGGGYVQLRVTSVTTAGEVVELALAQINSPVGTLSSSHSAPSSHLGKPSAIHAGQGHCLCVVVGARERRLRDEFPVMDLNRQGSAWSNGKLFVRRTNCVQSVASAIQHGNEALV